MSNPQNHPNESAAEALMHEKHTLREWMILCLQHPELMEEFDKLVKPEPIK